MTSTRRSFLAAAAAAGSTLALPRALAAARPTAPGAGRAQLRLGVIGVGGRGRGNLEGVKDQHIVALCDVDRGRLAAAAEAFPDATTHVDFRELIAAGGLDAVVVSTPDHTHYPAAMLALRHGLDVYCEKPLTHTVVQARRLAEAAARRGLVTQMGTQIHANDNYRRVVEAVRGGVLGAVTEVHVFVNSTDWSAQRLPEQAPVPDGLDYDLWLGPAASQPYRQGFHPAGWRRYWAFGGGTTADMACHHMDLPFWALDLRAPATVRAAGDAAPDEHCAPRGLSCEYEFPANGRRPAVRLTWWAGSRRPQQQLAARGLESWRNGTLFVGERGWLVSDYTRHQLGPEAAFADHEPPAPSMTPSPGHYAEWLQCCRDRTLPSCHFGYGGALTEAVLLGNAAYRGRPGERLRWDRDALRFDDAAASGFLDAELREGFRGE